MNSPRTQKVKDVTLWQGGQKATGSLELKPHHIIFTCAPEPSHAGAKDSDKAPGRQLWITYPIIANCVYRLSQFEQTPAAIYIRCRDFKFVSFHFHLDQTARDVYETIKAFTCKLGSIDKLYAFDYKPVPSERGLNGWEIYDARREFARQGIGEKQTHTGWRLSNINHDYAYSYTYPAVLVVPKLISDTTLNHAAKFRSRARIPALTYLHPVNNCSITRCAQPFVGIRNNRSVQDEKLVLAIFSTSRTRSPDSSSILSSSNEITPTGSLGQLPLSNSRESSVPTIVAEDEIIEAANAAARVYGSQQQNLIVDARPLTNAVANHTQGKGSENMENYKFATKKYLGIENIHIMRKSLDKVVDALKNADIATFPLSREQLDASGWMKHIAKILDGAAIISRNVGLSASHVLVHCSDGWDRTSQLCALSQLCLDPYYRTLEGFIVLVEKDWVSFGHMFRHRSGFLGSEKWFETEGGRMTPSPAQGDAAYNGVAPNALENALAQASKFFSRKSDAKDRLAGRAVDDAQSQESSPTAKRSSASLPKVVDSKVETKVSEVSPVFHQFLDATYQLLYQHPTRFEFNERFLKRLLYHLYSCQYGTFLGDSEKERIDTKVKERTRSVWDYFLSRRNDFINPKYDPEVDDRVKGRERLIFPDPEKARWWADSFGRRDDEMNAAPVVIQPPVEDLLGGGPTSYADPATPESKPTDANRDEYKIDGATSLPVPLLKKEPASPPISEGSAVVISPPHSEFEHISMDAEQMNVLSDHGVEDVPSPPDPESIGDLDPLGSQPVTARESTIGRLGFTDITGRVGSPKRGKVTGSPASVSPTSASGSGSRSQGAIVDSKGDSLSGEGIEMQ